MAGQKTAQDYQDDAKKRALNGGASATAQQQRQMTVEDYMAQAVGSVAPMTVNPFASLNQDVLSRVGKSWRDDWYYQLNDAEDLARMSAGRMPKYYDSQYNLSDTYDRYLYEHSLPPQSTLNKNYSKELLAWNKEQDEARAEAAQEAQIRAEDAARVAAKKKKEEKPGFFDWVGGLFGGGKEDPAQTPSGTDSGEKPYKTGFGVGSIGAGGFGTEKINGAANNLDVLWETIKPRQTVTPNGLEKANEGVGIGSAPSNYQTVSQQKDALKLAEYMKQAQNTDFAKNAIPGDGNLSRTYLGPRYRYINDLQGMRDGVNGTRSGAFDLMVGAMGGADIALARQGLGQVYANQYRLYDQMTREEVDVLNYTVATRGEREAERYLKLLEPTLTKRQAGEVDQMAEDLAEKPVLGSLVSVPLTAASAMEGGMTMLAGIGGKELSEDDAFRSATRLSSGIRDRISGQMTPVGSFLYGTGMSMLDTAFRLPFGGGGLAVAGLSAASSTVQNAIEKGASTEEAVTLGGFAGAAEIVFEKLSLDNLFSAKAAGTLGQLAKEILKQSGIEGSEEVFTEVANIITNRVVMGDKSDWQKSINGYMAQGLSYEDALAKTRMDNAIQIGLAGLGGAISGGAFGGGAQTIHLTGIGQQTTGTYNPFRSIPAGLQTMNAYNAAMKEAPAMTAEARVSFARDIEAIGVDERTKVRVMNTVDALASRPDAWLSDQGRGALETLNQVISDAADTSRERKAKQTAARTRVGANLTTLYDAMLSAQKAAAAAQSSGIVRDYTSALTRFSDAVRKYKTASETTAADLEAERVADENAAKKATAAVNSAAKTAEVAIPTEHERMKRAVRTLDEAYAAMEQAAQSGNAREYQSMSEIVEDIINPLPRGLTLDQVFANMEIALEGNDTRAYEQQEKYLKRFTTAAAREAQEANDGNGFANESAVPAAQGLTYARAADNVSTAGKTAPAAAQKPDNGTFEIIDYMANGSGVPRYQQTAPAAKTTQDFDITDYLVNGGETDGRQGNNVLRNANEIQGTRRGRGGNQSETHSTVRQGEGGSKTPSRGAGSSGTIQAKGTGIWRNAERAGLEKAVSDWNDRLRRDGARNFEFSKTDLRPAKTIAPQTAKRIALLKDALAQDIFLYDSDRADAPAGFKQNGKIFVRNTESPELVFQAAHERAHLDPRLQAAANDVFEKLPDREWRAMRAARAENLRESFGPEYSEHDTDAAIKEEIAANLYGAYEYESIIGRPAYKQFGVSEETYYKFADAFMEALGSEQNPEYDLQADVARVEYMNDAEADVTKFSPPTWLSGKKEQEEYYWAGKRQSVRNTKTEMREAGKSPFIQSYAEFRDYIKDIRSGKETAIRTFGKVEDRLAAAITEKSKGKLDISGSYLEIIPDKVLHSEMNHAEAKQQGNIPVGTYYWENLPVLIDEFDAVVYTDLQGDKGAKFALAFYTKGGVMLIPFTVSQGRVSVHPRNMIGYEEDALQKSTKKQSLVGSRGKRTLPGLWHNPRTLTRLLQTFYLLCGKTATPKT